MTDDDRYEISVLAEALHTARLAYEAHCMMNTSEDPTKRAQGFVALQLARAEMVEAEAKLNAALARIAAKA